MQYFEITFTNKPCNETINDVLSALLADIGFESFVDHPEGIIAYIPSTLYDESNLRKVIETFPLLDISIKYTTELIEDKDWNEEWEKNFFQPLYIGDNCIIHSTFHKDIPDREYNIIINPKMAFGTGHHETTSLIITELLKTDLTGKSVLDMGCGTSILAILAAKRGASPILAIDIDSWCVDNSIENIKLNNITDIAVELGDAASLKNKGMFDIIIANINRNILLNDMRYYTKHMKKGSHIFISGFYTQDIPLLRREADKLGLIFDYSDEKNNWAVVRFTLS